MKSCPNCGELIGDNVKECFNCHFNYSYGRVISPKEISYERDNAEAAKQQALERQRQFELQRTAQLEKNPKYEYKTEIIYDNSDGTVNHNEINRILTNYSSDGWRLHSVYTNEIGKTATSVSVGSFGSGTNATINQTVMIFERCVKA